MKGLDGPFVVESTPWDLVSPEVIPYVGVGPIEYRMDAQKGWPGRIGRLGELERGWQGFQCVLLVSENQRRGEIKHAGTHNHEDRLA